MFIIHNNMYSQAFLEATYTSFHCLPNFFGY